MQTTRRELLAVTAGALAATGVARTASAAPTATGGPRLRGTDRSAVQAAVDAVVTGPVVGVVASLVTPEGRIDTASGRRMLGHPAPARPADRAHVASITKAMVATCVFQEIEKGTLSLTTTIDDVLPGLWPGRGGVTVGQLLNHTSGMPDAIWVLMEHKPLWDISPELLVRVVGRHYTQEDLVAIARQDDWWFEPGTDWGYSNTGYVVLSMILERITGRPIGDLLRSRVFKPAKMTSARLEDGPMVRGVELQDAAVWEDGTARRLDVIDESIFSGAGGVTATAADITDFYGALFTGRLVSQASVDAMITPVGAAAAYDYGYGLFRFPDPCTGGWLYGHDGGGFGSISMALSTRDASRRLALTWVGRPYYVAGWQQVWAQEEKLIETAFLTGCSTVTTATAGAGAASGHGRLG